MRKRGDAAVSWIPYCADPGELARYFRAADLFVHPGVQETFGLVALESQACGTPVVGIRGANMMDFSRTGLAGRRKTTRSRWRDAIEAFSARDLTAMGESASRSGRGHGYSWPQVFDEQFCIYREVCANYRRS